MLSVPKRVLVGWVRAGAIFVVWLIGGCHAEVRETHYFASFAPGKPAEPVNFFRLDVVGKSRFTNARYVAGFYDERAVDLFFNELKPSSDPPSRPLFAANLTEPGTGDVLKPLSPGDTGAFVMVLSTNADAIANAIGSFAESQEVANNISTLLNQKELVKASQNATGFSGEQMLAGAFASELDTVLSNDALGASADSARAAMLRGLNLIAQSLGATQSFATVAEVQAWLAVRRTLPTPRSTP